MAAVNVTAKWCKCQVERRLARRQAGRLAGGLAVGWLGGCGCGRESRGGGGGQQDSARPYGTIYPPRTDFYNVFTWKASETICEVAS